MTSCSDEPNQIRSIEPQVQILNEGSVVVDEDHEVNDEYLDYDIDELKNQLGIGGIESALKSLTEKINSIGSNKNPETGTSSATESVFDPTEELVAVTESATVDTNTKTLESSEFLPSIFEETESFGPDVAEVVAQRINDSVSKKPLETKLTELKDKYKTPKNCNLLCVPKVNLELWHDLPRNTKTKDLGLQEIQRNLVKSAQPVLQLLDMTLKAQKEQKQIETSTIIALVADASTFLGHTSYLTSLKRREFLKPDIAPAYQSVCSKSNPITTYLFGDELAKHIKEISEVNKIAKKTMSRTHSYNSTKRSGFDYKSNNSSGTRYNQRGGRRPFLGYGNKTPYSDRRQTQVTSNTKSYRDSKDKA